MPAARLVTHLLTAIAACTAFRQVSHWLQPGAADVFLDFISYSSGPLAEDLLEEVSCPVSILWGEKDPWEKLEWGRGFQKHQVVEEFVTIPGGNWGQDALEVCVPLVRTMHEGGVGLDTADAPGAQQSRLSM